MGQQGHRAYELIGVDFAVSVLVEVLEDELALSIRALEVLL
jgi:hypothetical protein